ncbi:hypothetical protein N657DRAFT_682351 [Parathielavia appendiculata]|uniref:Protein kinase domain-containing protein n=1 Tax=Parathielavia appendiculata TaxID=2587402 RepID=A0AAN6Z1T5_9PEZI|nr:hypothetical protein N657DRAFT_682351 [Parathielavia appendiculata]
MEVIEVADACAGDSDVYDPRFTKAPEPLPNNVHIKRQSLLDYGDQVSTWKFTDLMLHELDICECLAKHPHPNVAKYLERLVEDGRMTALCFRRYARTLQETVSSSEQVDTQACPRGIQEGIKHLHQLGLVHNDLNPSNVMMHSHGSNPVIIDFDSC